MFIKNIARLLEGLIYILLGIVIATIVISFFKPLSENTFVEVMEEIIEASLFTILILQPVSIIFKKYVNISEYNGSNQLLYKVIYVIKQTHIALGCLFIGLRILHIEINFLYESLEWSMETITGILISILLIPTIIYAILRINNTEKYRKPHRFFLLLTYLMYIFHLLH